MGCLRRLFCCCCPEDSKDTEHENYRAYPGHKYPRVKYPDPEFNHPQYLSRGYNDEQPLVINPQDSVFVSIREKLSSWSLPKSNSTLVTERVNKFDEFLDEEYNNQESFINQDAVSVTSRLSEMFE